MELNEFLELFREQLETTEKESVTSITVYKDLDEWSSILALSIIAMVDDELEVTIGSKEIMTSGTIEELYRAVIKKKNEK